MRITTGKVRDGAIDLQGEVLPEGSTVTVIAPDDEEAFELGASEEAELKAAMEEADRDQTVDSSVVRDLLHRR
ncbi:MAG TPA: hypothetical protein VLD59_20590 [Steroidobacteraceae bacterium]|jgi:hypothetical protein|nr:hypothetical protein [Steroidobacteraceae bacterium]